MTPEPKWAAPRTPSDGLWMLLLWAAVAALALWIYRTDIAALALVDPDDWLRLVQVRDLLAGQPWYDLHQYRVNPAAGGADMHWSRFIDIQLGGLIVLMTPALGAVEAERWAAALYPLLLLLPLFWLVRRIVLLLGGDRVMLWLGLLMAATSVGYLHLFAPLRIDHHNWQLVLAVALLWLALGPPSLWRGLAAALVSAIFVEISLEGMPYLAIFGGLFALDWLRDPRTSARLRGYALGQVLLLPGWLLLMRGADPVMQVSCDAFSRPYVAGAVAAGTMLAILMHWGGGHPQRLRRFAIVVLAGCAGAAAFVASGPACLAGPFADLSPLVRSLWYLGMAEGRPVWEQPVHVMFTLGTTSFLGLGATLWAARRDAGTPQGTEWLRVAIVASAAILLSLLVLRTTAAAHAYVIPGYAMAAAMFLRWARGLRWPLLRVPATVATLLAFPVSVLTLAAAVPLRADAGASAALAGPCLTPGAVRRLSAMPTGTILVTLDHAPELLARTAHSVVVTGHHRGHRQIHAVLTAFMAPPGDAAGPVRAVGADYILVCRGTRDIEYLANRAPGGLAAQLLAQRPPPWLRFVPDFSAGIADIYRVLPADRHWPIAPKPGKRRGALASDQKGLL